MSTDKNLPLNYNRWQIFSDVAQVERAAEREITAAAQHALKRRGVFHLVLTGGNTSRPIYEALCTIETDWDRWQIWFGDERCLPPEDSQRNSRIASETWLDHVAIPPDNIHPIPSERGPQAAADIYAGLLAAVPIFDLVLLGLGEDGHVASLFPGASWHVKSDLPAVLPVFDSPKAPAQRVSLSPARLSAARKVLFIIVGAGKRNAVNKWRAGNSIPASSITPAAGVDIYVDVAAYGNEVQIGSD